MLFRKSGRKIFVVHHPSPCFGVPGGPWGSLGVPGGPWRGCVLNGRTWRHIHCPLWPALTVSVHLYLARAAYRGHANTVFTGGGARSAPCAEGTMSAGRCWELSPGRWSGTKLLAFWQIGSDLEQMRTACSFMCRPKILTDILVVRSRVPLQKSVSMVLFKN